MTTKVLLQNIIEGIFSKDKKKIKEVTKKKKEKKRD